MFDYKSEAEINRYRQMLRIEAGRAALDRINGQTKQVRRDGYVNLLNKYGTAQDNSTAYSFSPMWTLRRCTRTAACSRRSLTPLLRKL